MARWKLMTPHYLNVKELDGEPVEFIYQEQDLTTMRNRRKSFKVPLLLDPKDPSYVNDPNYGIVVSDGKNAMLRDYIFLGDPTPDMEPLDDEAREISDRFKEKWINPIDSLPGNGDYSQSLIAVFEKQMNALAAQAQQNVQPQSLKSVDPEAFKLMQEQLTALMARNAELEAAKPEARR